MNSLRIVSVLVGLAIQSNAAFPFLTLTNPSPTGRPGAFGAAMALVGRDKLVIGAPRYGHGGAYLFNTEGALLNTFTNPHPELEGTGFGSAIAAVGTNAFLIAAPLPGNPAGVGTAAAFLYNLDGALIQSITNVAVADEYGWATASLGADRLVISHHDVVQIVATNGILLHSISNPFPDLGRSRTGFGLSLATVGPDKVLINSGVAETNTTGLAFLFTTNGTLLSTFFAPSNASSRANALAALIEDKVVICSLGSAMIFDLTGSLLLTITNPAPDHLLGFGWRVEPFGDHLLVWGVLSNRSGAAFLYNSEGELLNVFVNPRPQERGDCFGCSALGINSDILAISDSEPYLSIGEAVYLYRDPIAASLTIRSLDPGVFRVEWPISSGWELEKSTLLNGPNWTPLPYYVSREGLTNSVNYETQDESAGFAFFRLQWRDKQTDLTTRRSPIP